MIKIPHSRPSFGTEFEATALAVIQSGMTAQGAETNKLEQQISTQLSHRTVLATDSGTSALMLLIRHLTHGKTPARIGIPSFACTSLLYAVRAVGATPVFLDCDEQLCLEKEGLFETAQTLDALVLVHPFGMVEPLAQEQFPCPVIEDIAQSAGAILHGQPVGTFTDYAIGSLYATKPWGGAYGGFIAAKDANQIDAIRRMTNPDQDDLTLAYAGHHQLSNLHAVLATQRIEKSISETTERADLAARYNEILQDLAATPIHSHSESKGNHFRYIIRCENDAEPVIQKLQAMGIDARKPIQAPLHHSDQQSICPHAETMWQRCISLPMLTTMSSLEFAHMQQGMKQCLPS